MADSRPRPDDQCHGESVSRSNRARGKGPAGGALTVRPLDDPHGRQVPAPPQLSAADFTTAVSGAVTLEEEARRRVLVAYQTRKQDELTHPFLHEKTTWGLVPFIQTDQFAAHLRGDLDGYPPFLWR